MNMTKKKDIFKWESKKYEELLERSCGTQQGREGPPSSTTPFTLCQQGFLYFILDQHLIYSSKMTVQISMLRQAVNMKTSEGAPQPIWQKASREGGDHFLWKYAHA